MCVPDTAKTLNVRVLNLMSKTNETRQIKWRESCKCKCRLDASACNNKQRWNKNKCRCECKELIYKGVWDKGSIWNPSNRECEFDKSCDVRENCTCRKKLVNKLAEECSESEGEVKIAGIILAKNKSMRKCSPCALYIVLFSIIFIINIGIDTYFVYCRYMNRSKKTGAKYNYIYQATI